MADSVKIALEPRPTLTLAFDEVLGVYEWMLRVGYIDPEVYPHIHAFYAKLQSFIIAEAVRKHTTAAQQMVEEHDSDTKV